MKKSQIKAFKDKIILKGTFKEQTIELPDSSKQGTSRKLAMLKSLKVFSVGDNIEGLEVGDEVLITRYLLQDSSKTVFMHRQKISDNEFYIAVEEKDIVALWK
jgi:hypothetical protein